MSQFRRQAPQGLPGGDGRPAPEAAPAG
jgi:hypothetical protein